MQWQIYPLIIADQQLHIERSEQLLSTIQPGDQPILSWSMADPTALVLGFSQKLDMVNAAGLPVYRRRAGGTAVLVGPHLLSLDVILPTGHPLIHADIVESYRWFGEAWVATLQKFSIQARCVAPAEAHAQRALRKNPETSVYEQLMHRACYGSLSPYEVVVGNRKIVGLDMVRRRVGTLLQAGILLHWDPTLLCTLLGHTKEEQEFLSKGLQERAVGLDTLAACLIDPEEIIRAFEQTLSNISVFYPSKDIAEPHVPSSSCANEY